MTEHELQQLLHQESNRVDWKRGGDPENIVETLAAFANDYEQVGGGSALCGIEEVTDSQGVVTSRITGVSSVEALRLKNRIFELSRKFVMPPIEPQFDSVVLASSQQVLIVWIAATGDLHTFKKNVVVRLGDKTVQPTQKQHATLAQRTASVAWLEQPCPGATLADIDQFAVAALANGRFPEGGSSEFLQPGYRMFGSAPALTQLMPGPSNPEVVPTRFAILLAGKNPQHFMPGAFVKLTRFQGLTRADAVFSMNEFFGPILLLVRQVMEKIDAEVFVIVDKTKDFLSGGQNRIRYSSKALEEILVNALVHRDYQDPHSTKIYIFPDRIEFESPGGLTGFESIDEAKKGRTQWRNPVLARFLREAGLAQEAGTGLPRAIRETLAIAGSEPRFEIDNWFRVMVPAYYPEPDLVTTTEPVALDDMALMISVGRGTIDRKLIARSVPEFATMPSERIQSFHNRHFVEGEQWVELVRELRDWLQMHAENPQVRELHLFFRGPIAIGPLIGAMMRRKPFVVYSYDEEALIYRRIYRVDRKLLQES